MLTHVYDKATGTMFFIVAIQLMEEVIYKNDTNLYNMDLVSYDGEMTIYNVPATITMESGTVTGYAMADISNVIADLTGVEDKTYDYHNEKNTQLYDCTCANGVLTNCPEVASIPDVPQSKTLIEAIDKLSEALSKAKAKEQE